MSHYDVLIVGAGLSGVGAAVHLTTKCPNKSFLVFESRDEVGGTWDLFQYPGIRSDSDMFTLGYCFKPWTTAKCIADGPSILNYIKETAKEYGVDSKIRLRHKVVRLSWSSERSQWDVEVEVDKKPQHVHFTCNFLMTCTGYYRYDVGYSPNFPGQETFKGTVIHPQFWPKDLDYTGKRVVIIGSGATAITLLPSMADKAAHVTMLQRSPTYIFARPSEIPFTVILRKILPASLAYAIIRWVFILQSVLLFYLARTKPEKTKKFIISETKKYLPEGYDVKKHFTPSYNPWYQRVCLAPDADFFQPIKSGKASVVTDKIATFTPKGIKLESGEELDADIIISATGLVVKVLAGVEIVVDGQQIDLSKQWFYKGVMFSGLPNLACALGYTNASWTLKADLNEDYACRLINFMSASGYTKAVPTRTEEESKMEGAPWADFSSGYIQRTVNELPKQGPKYPWKLYQNYAKDYFLNQYGAIVDGVMQFSGNGVPPPKPAIIPVWALAAIAAVAVPLVLLLIRA